MFRFRASKATTFLATLLCFTSVFLYLSPTAHQAVLTADTSPIKYGEDGLVRGWDEVHSLLDEGGLDKWEKERLKGLRDRHPILDLIQDGKAKWEGLLARSAQ
jgi:hypothetical protein